MILLVVILAFSVILCGVGLISEIRASNMQIRQIRSLEERNEQLQNRNLQLMKILGETNRKAEEMERKSRKKLLEKDSIISILESENNELHEKCSEFEKSKEESEEPIEISKT